MMSRISSGVGHLAGSESGMGVFINDVTPEQVAAQLRAAAAKAPS